MRLDVCKSSSLEKDTDELGEKLIFSKKNHLHKKILVFILVTPFLNRYAVSKKLKKTIAKKWKNQLYSTNFTNENLSYERKKGEWMVINLFGMAEG